MTFLEAIDVKGILASPHVLSASLPLSRFCLGSFFFVVRLGLTLGLPAACRELLVDDSYVAMAIGEEVKLRRCCWQEETLQVRLHLTCMFSAMRKLCCPPDRLRGGIPDGII